MPGRISALVVPALLAVLGAAPGAAQSPAMTAPTAIDVGRFSAASPDGPLPHGWKPWIITRTKKKTSYEIVKNDGTVVVKAVSEDSASGIQREIRIDPKEFSILQWRWKADNLITDANNYRKETEDSPLRMMVSFEGDTGKLDLGDRMLFKMIKAISGQELPYATLMYIWENKATPGTVIPGPRTRRIQMIVVESGPSKVGQWLSEERNVYEDYRQAFGEDPPMINAVGIMTDTDNTGEAATAWYGDIVFRKAEKPRE